MKVAIVGTAPSSRLLAPFDDESVEIWACSPGIAPDFSTFCDLPRLDRWFELHRWDEPALIEKLGPDGLAAYKRWMQQLEATVVTQEPLAGCEQYPLDTILQNFGNYFTNTISYMLAYAIELGATEIHIAGVDMAAIDEYGAQRPSCEYFIGLARGRGIAVTVPAVSDLLKVRAIYAFSGEDAYSAKCKARASELAGRLHQAKHEMELFSRQHAGALSALEEIDSFKTLLNGELTPSLAETIADREARLAHDAHAAASQAQQRKETIHALMGAEEDPKYWSQWR